MTKWLVILCLSWAVILGGGCQTTDNPREGGLFSYDPKAYDKRLEERQKKLDEVKQEQAAEQQRKEQLESEAAGKRTQRDALAADLAALDKDISRLEARIVEAKSQSEAADKKRWELNTKLRAVKRELKKVREDSSGGAAARKQELEDLKQRIDKLLEEAEALSKM